MLINLQNINFDELAKFLSTDVKTTDTCTLDKKDFATLLSYLISKNENMVYGFESTGVGVTNEMRQTGETSTSGDVTFFENGSISLAACENEMLNAELILQSDSKENISIPVTIVFAGHDGDTEPDRIALALFIDVNTVNALVNTKKTHGKESIDLKSYEGTQIVDDSVTHTVDTSSVVSENRDVLEETHGKEGIDLKDYNGTQIVDDSVTHAVDTSSVVLENRDVPEETHGKESIDLKSYEGTQIVDDSVTHAVDTSSVVLENEKVLEKTPLIYTNLSQPVQFDSGLIGSDITNNSDNIDNDKIIITEYDFPQKNLSEAQNGIKSNVNYIASRVSVEKFVIEAAEKDTDVPRFFLYTSSDKAPLVVKPLETTSSDTALLKLLQKYSSSGEQIEIAIVVKSGTSVKSGSKSIPTTNASNNNSASQSSTLFKGTVHDNVMSQENVADIFSAQISNQDILKQLNIKGLPVTDIGPKIVHEKAEIRNTTVLYSTNELNPGLVEIENNFKVDSETLEYLRYTRINNQNSVFSDINTAEKGVEFLDDGSTQIVNSPEMIGKESEAVKEFGGKIINDSDKSVKSMFHRAEINTSIESSMDVLPTHSTQKFNKDEGFLNSRVTLYENGSENTSQDHNIAAAFDSNETMIKNKPIIENSTSSSMIKESSKVELADSENISVGIKNIQDNTVEGNDNSSHISRENIEGAGAGKTVTKQSITYSSVSGAEVISDGEKKGESSKSNSEIKTSYRADNSERNAESNVPNKDNLQVINVSENNEAKEIAQDLNDLELTQKNLSGLEKPSWDNIPETKMDSGEQYFGLQGTSENMGESIFSSRLVTYSRGRIYSEADEKQVLKSIVRQARFMNHKGLSSAVIKLEPPSLGRLQLDIITDHSRITGRIIVESQEVKELIQSSISELRESLTQNGLKVDSFDVQVGHNGGSDNWARMEIFKNFAKIAQNGSTYANNSSVPSEDQTTISKPLRNKSMYSEVFDIWV